MMTCAVISLDRAANPCILKGRKVARSSNWAVFPLLAHSSRIIAEHGEEDQHAYLGTTLRPRTPLKLHKHLGASSTAAPFASVRTGHVKPVTSVKAHRKKRETFTFAPSCLTHMSRLEAAPVVCDTCLKPRNITQPAET